MVRFRLRLPGFRSKLWITDQRTGVYRGVYDWDGAGRAETYATTLTALLRLVCVPGSVGFHVEPGVRRDDFLHHPGSPAVGEDRPAPRRAVRAGDRLPDGLVVRDGEDVRLYDALCAPGFHVLLCGGTGDFDPRAAGVLARLGGRGVPLLVHRLARAPAPGVLADPRGEVLGRLGGGTAVYLIRPDRYVGYRSCGPGLDGLARYLRLTFPGHRPTSPVGA